MSKAETSKETAGLEVVDGAVSITLGGKERKLKWSNRALFRVSERGYQEMDDAKSFASMCVYVWAMLGDKTIEPEDVADMFDLSDEEQIKQLGAAIDKAVELGKK